MRNKVALPRRTRQAQCGNRHLAALALALWGGVAAADVELVCPCRIEATPDTLTLTLGLRNEAAEAATDIVVEASIFTPQTDTRPAGRQTIGRWRLATTVPANATTPAASFTTVRQAAAGRDSLALTIDVAGELRPGTVWTQPVDVTAPSWTTRDQDFLADADGDGVGDLNEGIAGTDPASADSTPGASTIDVLALYNRGFATLYHGDPLARIHHVVTLANELFRNNEVLLQLRIVGFAEQEVEPDWNVFAAPDRAAMKRLEAAHGADIVLMFRPINTVGPICGWADLPRHDRGYLWPAEAGGLWRNLATVFGNCSGVTTAHEVGHVLGLGHSLRQGEIGTFRWARGHYVYPDDGLGISAPGTLMTYGHSYTDWFSNPARDCGGAPCGVARGRPDGANAVAALNVTRFQVAALRPAKTDRDGDGFVDAVDQAPTDPALWRDTDGDGENNDHDADDDGDGVADEQDAFPLDAAEWADQDGDGVGDNGDAFPTDPAESRDEDGDGLGDSANRAVPLFVQYDDVFGRQGFVRIINRSAQAGTACVLAIDDAGARRGPATLRLAPHAALHFNSGHLENGSEALGLPGFGSGTGSWRLVVTSELDVEVLAYVRAAGGFLTSVHDTAPQQGDAHMVRFFNPARNQRQRSLLRLVNPSGSAVSATVLGTDDTGASPGPGVQVTVPAGVSRWLTAAELEDGAGLTGHLGQGRGKWRLRVLADGALRVMSLLQSPTGHLSNLSTAPSMELPWLNAGSVFAMFPSTADRPWQGFARLINRDINWNLVGVDAYKARYDGPPPLALLNLPVDGTRHFNSEHLEHGNPAIEMVGIGAGEEPWWLAVSGSENIDAANYIRTDDGFVTAMHDLAPATFARTAPGASRHDVVIFNPASNTAQRSLLRLVNPGPDRAEVTISSRDDAGRPGGSVQLPLPSFGARILTAAELEQGAEDIDGAFGDGSGKWRLVLTANMPIAVMSLLQSPSGHLTNLSTGTASRPLFEPETDEANAAH